ncbi:MAG: alpha-ketoacid dehydrogenase subunit beta [Deltaproteobacteria bacterium]|nr:alpha-ketoacid dehydrogenase subunit beta [Deltaproteobacteria bacterium]MBI4374000.1 alpha-ketoacid dehydrogenase subunit beta [Deltaproteobacteria bacterium]
MPVMTYGEAIRDGLRQAMKGDERVYLLGEDIAEYGGVYGITKGLIKEFGKKRVKNTPLSEGAIIGEAIGAAIAGLRPVAEIQFSDFMTTAFSTLVDVAAPYRFRIGTPVPIVIRAPSGGGLRIGPYHSKSTEAWYFHVPGLKLVYPSTPSDAKGLLAAAIEDEDPVLFFEHKKLYYEIREEVPEGAYLVPLGKAIVRREGSHITLITYGAMVHRALRAAEKLFHEDGIGIEVVDLRSLIPLDEETVLNSFKKTNRVIILHEAPLRGGVGAELESLICEKGFDSLMAPPIRLAAKMTPIPVAPSLEDYYLPSEQDIVDAAKRLVQY